MEDNVPVLPIKEAIDLVVEDIKSDPEKLKYVKSVGDYVCSEFPVIRGAHILGSAYFIDLEHVKQKQIIKQITISLGFKLENTSSYVLFIRDIGKNPGIFYETKH